MPSPSKVVDGDSMFMTDYTPDSDSLVADRHLVRRLLKGDEAAFDHFAENFIPRVHRFVLRRLGGQSDPAVDIAQAALAKAMAKLDTWRGEATLLTWLCSICRNEIAAHFRRLSSRPEEVEWSQIEHQSPLISPRPTPEDEFDRNETRQRVHEALEGLPENQAAALQWKYLEGRSVAEIARRLGLSEKAAESLLSRGRVKFRTIYETRNEEGPVGSVQGIHS